MPPVGPESRQASMMLRGLYAIADTGMLTEPAFAPAVEAALTGGARLVLNIVSSPKIGRAHV